MLRPSSYFTSLRFRLLAISGVVVLLLSLATMWNTARALMQISVDDLSVSIRQTAETLNLAVAPHTSFEGLKTIQVYLDELVDGADGRLVYLAVLDDEQHVILHTKRTPAVLPDPEVPLERQIATGIAHVSQPILIYQNRVGRLRYGLSTASYNEVRNKVIRHNMLLLLGGLGVLIGLIAVLGLRMDQRVRPLINATKALAAGDMDARAPIKGRDELSYLAAVFNKMAGSVQERVAESQARQAEIGALNEQLEQRVHERTVDLQEMVRSLESFNQAVSHDLRGPLGGISGLAQLAAQALERNDDSLARSALPAIAKQAITTEHMLNSLLTLARVGDAAVARQDVQLGYMVQEVIDQLAMSKPAQAMPRFVLHELPTLQTDPALLRPALLNLIGNAVKFSAKSTQPVVEIGALHGEDNGFRTIFIKDNGPGFDPGAVDRLFTPFVRLHGDQFDGHGVGLSIVRRAIHKLGGGVWAKAQPGQGATFYFTLPTVAANAPSHADAVADLGPQQHAA